jgi:hypothetical protein
MTNNPKALFVAITIALLNSCANQESHQKNQTKNEGIVEIEEVVESETQSFKFPLFDYITFDIPSGQTVGFVSLSDIDRLSQHPDSIAIPIKREEYFVLSPEYRMRFLSRTKIAESDTVFIYNYYTNTLQKIEVRKLKVAALLSGYAEAIEGYYSQYAYHIGFEIDPAFIKEHEYNFVYVGKQNPFVPGEVYPLKWEKISLDEFPSVAINSEEQSRLKEFKEDAYKFSSADYEFFVKEFTSHDFSFSRQLVVKSIESNKTVNVKLFHTSDFVENLPLNGFETTEPQLGFIFQFAGRLFKDKPPVFFGFQSHSAGCPYIYFIGDNEQRIEILCDNRH